jgi:NADP-dependent 3-hydroxy acid dehydrogenase YdfG
VYFDIYINKNFKKLRGMERWSGRVAIVTGAGAGIGAAIACLLAENGMKVVGVARRDERVKVRKKLSLFKDIV